MDRRLSPLILATALMAGGQQVSQDSWSERARLFEQRFSAGTGLRAELIPELEDMILELEVVAFEPSDQSRDQLEALFRTCLLYASLPTDQVDDWDRLELLELARDAAEQHGDQEYRAHARWRLASEYRDRGEFHTAEVTLREGLELSKVRGVRPLLLLSLAELTRTRGDLDATDSLLQQAEQSLQSLTPNFLLRRIAECSLHGMRGQWYLDQGLPDIATYAFDQEQAHADELDHPDLLAAAALHRANWWLATQQFATLVDRVPELLAQPELSHSPGLAAQLKVRLGIAQTQLARRDRNPDLETAANSTFNTTLQDPALSVFERLKAKLHLTDLMIRQGRWQEALPALQELEQGLAPASNTVPEAPFEDALYIHALLTKWTLANEGEDALLRDRLAAHEQAFAKFLKEWAQSPRRRGGVGFLHFGVERFFLGELMRLTAAVHGPKLGAELAFEKLLEAQAMGTFAREHGYRLQHWAQIQQDVLLRQEGMLIYLTAPDLTHILSLDQSQIRYLSLPVSSEVEQRRRQFVRDLSTHPSQRSAARQKSLISNGQRLAELLFPDELRAAMTEWQTLSIVGLDSLGYLPFEALPWNHQTTLGAAFPISYLPSVPVGHLLAERNQSPEGNAFQAEIALLAAPDFDPALREYGQQLATIPWQAADSWRLVSPYREPRQLWTGADLTRNQLLNPSLAHTQVLQILTHGIHDFSRERPAGLVFTPQAPNNGVMWCEDVERMDAPPLVVVSACGASRGPLRRGEDGIAHLGGAFLRAGAQTVVISPGKIELESTLDLLEVFHRELRSGQSPAMALQTARRHLQQSEQFSDPFFSLSHVLGLGHRPFFDRED